MVQNEPTNESVWHTFWLVLVRSGTFKIVQCFTTTQRVLNVRKANENFVIACGSTLFESTCILRSLACSKNAQNLELHDMPVPLKHSEPLNLGGGVQRQCETA